jgi:hypothetical protein
MKSAEQYLNEAIAELQDAIEDYRALSSMTYKEWEEKNTISGRTPQTMIVYRRKQGEYAVKFLKQRQLNFESLEKAELELYKLKQLRLYLEKYT